MYGIGNVVELEWFAFFSLSNSNVTPRSRGPGRLYSNYCRPMNIHPILSHCLPKSLYPSWLHAQYRASRSTYWLGKDAFKLLVHQVSRYPWIRVNGGHQTKEISLYFNWWLKEPLVASCITIPGSFWSPRDWSVLQEWLFKEPAWSKGLCTYMHVYLSSI